MLIASRIRSATAAHSQRIIFVLDDQFRAKSILVLQYSISDYIVFQHLFIFLSLFLLGELKSASSGPLKKLGDMFRRHPEYFVSDKETCFRKVESGCCAYNLMYFAINLVDTS